jgi:ParB-like chromosome segregation protein Spo0J
MTDKNSEILKIESWDIEKIIPYENNAKIHTVEKVAKLAKTIKEFGFNVPILIDEAGIILAGHGRRLAALKLKFKKIPVIVKRNLTEVQKGVYRIADNKVSSNDYDDTLLANEIRELMIESERELLLLDAELFGMEPIELGSILEKFSTDDIGMMLPDMDDLSDIEKPKAVVKDVEYEKSYVVSIKCSGEAEQLELWKQLKADGRDCSIMTM